jgi:hypothetical protein
VDESSSRSCSSSSSRSRSPRTYGLIVGDRRQGYGSSRRPDGEPPVHAACPPHRLAAEAVNWPGRQQGAMEGQGTALRSRLGSVLFGSATTGNLHRVRVNSMHESYSPLGGGLLMTQHDARGSQSPGGVGTGLYSGILILAIITVFIAGLMVGRTPELLGQVDRSAGRSPARRCSSSSCPPWSCSARASPSRCPEPGGAGQRRAAWTDRDDVYAYALRLQQQRFGLRRAGRRRALVQPHARGVHVARPVRAHHVGPGAGRLWPRNPSGPAPRARCPPTPRCSPRCSSASP